MSLKRTKKLRRLMVIFALVLVVGIAYALPAGVLTFNGEVTAFNYDPDSLGLEIVDLVSPTTTSDGSNGTIVHVAGGSTDPVNQTVKITANFQNDEGDGINDELVFKFKLENKNANDDAEITDVTMDLKGNGSKIRVDGTYTWISVGDVIDAGDKTDEYNIRVRLYDDVVYTDTDNFEFELKVTYDEKV